MHQLHCTCFRFTKKAYLYLDEAHSIGALGPRGRGAVDYFGCDPQDVDILMGTFTKSFGAAGGYIAGSKVSNRNFKCKSAFFVLIFLFVVFIYRNWSITCERPVTLPVTLLQCHHQWLSKSFLLCASSWAKTAPMKVCFIFAWHAYWSHCSLTNWISYTGQRRLKQLLNNSRYFRQKLLQLGLIVYGNDNSPVIPVLLYMPAKIV